MLQQTNKEAGPLSQAEKAYGLGLLCIEDDRVGDAVSLLRLAGQLDPQNAGAPYALGSLMEALGNPLEALVLYRRAESAQPSHKPARKARKELQARLAQAQLLRNQALMSKCA